MIQHHILSASEHLYKFMSINSSEQFEKYKTGTLKFMNEFEINTNLQTVFTDGSDMVKVVNVASNS